MPKFYVFQHVPYEGLGNFEASFRDSGVNLHFLQSYREDLSTLHLAEREEVDALVVMGGPMSANDEHRLSFIREELRLIEEALQKEIPILGICLGAQMLAKVLGAKVSRGIKKEIGWYPLSLLPAADQDALFKDLPGEVKMFQWHGETFDLPKGASLLASSELYPHQAFRFGQKAYGLQFHPEMTLPMIRDWLNEGKDEVEKAGLPHSAQDILQQSTQFVKILSEWVQRIAWGFTSLVK
jgi:GMP synthase (glutamine-hydrolysing)